MRAAILLLALGACTAEVVVRPVMAPVDRPRPPKDIATRCGGVEWEPIRLPTTAADQIAGRQRDRAAADDAIDTCDGRRAGAVQHIRRLGSTP
ncbi:MAG: hypothetical protein ACRC67_27240 [Inquilinus sp.]|uniref:hypothetical protein n=1 Tax=Inquilinus sp. TaxID=1932117 RepID=UPI003F3AB27C